jgi:predicted metal-dependent hydrolase
MKKLRIRHRVEYTRNKHSRAVCRGETIIIRLARNLSKTEEQEHIQSLLRRMTHLVLEERQKILIDPFRHLLNGGQSLTVTTATGKKYYITLEPGARTSARKSGLHWRVAVGPHIRRAALHRFLWSLIAKSEKERIEALVQSINHATYRHLVRGVSLRFATTQWGSCSPRGIIMLNSALLFLPPSLLKYVIVHELAHRRVPNHSSTYWREVEWALPTYRSAYKMLQNYRLPTL